MGREWRLKPYSFGWAGLGGDWEWCEETSHFVHQPIYIRVSLALARYSYEHVDHRPIATPQFMRKFLTLKKREKISKSTIKENIFEKGRTWVPPMEISVRKKEGRVQIKSISSNGNFFGSRRSPKNPSRLRLSLLHRSVPPPPTDLADAGRSGESNLYIEFFNKVVFSVDYVRVLIVAFASASMEMTSSIISDLRLFV
jgi:hypothetical protein